MTPSPIAWIGAGIMGRPMARNLLAAGCALRVYARRPERARELFDAGAERCASPAAAAAGAEATVVIVADTPDAVEVILGGGGVREGARAGHTVVDMSTISPTETRRIAGLLAAGGVAMLDAPVSGGERGAIDGALSIMVGGPEDAYERMRPLLEVLGGQVRRVGGAGAGQVAKACNQLLVAQTMAAVAEAFLLAEARGADPAAVREALLGGFAYSRILEAHGARMLADDYRPGFKAALHLKDLKIVADEARAAGLDLPGSERAARLLAALVDGGGGELDSAAIARTVRAESGMKLSE